jgi:4-hydroxybenzoate polyprenyltransferase
VADRLGVVYFAGLAVAAVSILVEHTMVRADDLSRVNVAFFTMNGIVSLVLCAATFIDVYWW